MDVFTAIKERQSCRSFKGGTVSRDDLEAIVEAARLAPSAVNGQPWMFHIVDQDPLKSLVAKALTQSFNRQASAFIVVEMLPTKLPARVLGAVKKQPYAAIDIGIASAHLALAATAKGYASCLIGWFKEGTLKEVLGIPKTSRIHIVLSIGHAVHDTVREKKRKPFEKIARFVNKDDVK